MNNQSFLARVNMKQKVLSDSASTNGMYFSWPQAVAALSIWMLVFLSKTVFEELKHVVEMALC